MTEPQDVLRRILSGPPLEIDEARCLRSSGADCRECEASCPLGIESIPETLATGISPQACAGCGACAAACPTGCLEAGSREYGRLVRKLSQAGSEARDTVILACEKDGREDTLPVSCVRVLDLPLALHAWASGVREVRLGTSGCRDCPLGPLPDPALERLLTAAASWAVALGTDRAITVERAVDRPEVLGQGVTRRQLFGSIAAAGRSLLPSDDGGDPGFVGHPGGSGRRALAVSALERLGLTQDDVDLPHAETGPLARLRPRADVGRCSGCGECVAFCPTAALRVSVRDDAWRITLSPRRCVGCGECERLCRWDAMALEEAGSRSYSSKRLRLVVRESRVCTRCGRAFGLRGPDAPAPSMCPACEASSSRFKGFY